MSFIYFQLSHTLLKTRPSVIFADFFCTSTATTNQNSDPTETLLNVLKTLFNSVGNSAVISRCKRSRCVSVCTSSVVSRDVISEYLHVHVVLLGREIAYGTVFRVTPITSGASELKLSRAQPKTTIPPWCKCATNCYTTD